MEINRRYIRKAINAAVITIFFVIMTIYTSFSMNDAPLTKEASAKTVREISSTL